MYLKDRIIEIPSSKPVDEIGRILLDAAQIMRERGLAKHTLCDSGGRVCMRGAMFAAIGWRPDPYVTWPSKLSREQWDLMARADARISKHLAGDHVGFNNKPERTAEEVISALESAARA